MKTYRDMIFIVLDELKIMSDDSVWEYEHIVALLNKYRAMLIKQRYLDKKVPMPSAFYQRLKLSFDINFYRGRIFKSTKKLPAITGNSMLNLHTFLFMDNGYQLNVNLINSQQFRVISYSRWPLKETCGTIANDGYMYIYSPAGAVIPAFMDNNGDIIVEEDAAEKILVSEVFKNQILYYDTILDNPLDIIEFNKLTVDSFLDVEFPCDESLSHVIVSLCLDELSKAMAIPRDEVNNANDDIAKQ